MRRESSPVWRPRRVLCWRLWWELRESMFATILGWQDRGFTSDAILMLIQVAGTLCMFDRGTKKLSKAD